MKQRTGMEVREGCDLAARLYAVAVQVFGLYVQADWVKRQCFPQTAQAEQLDHHAQLRGLQRRQAVCAEGTIRFFVNSAAETDRSIPAGTVCMTADLVRFETTRDGVLAAGALQIDVPARAVEAGSGGNVAPETIVSMAVAPVGVAGCRNPASFTGGVDEECDEELRERVLETFRRLPNGANAAFYQQQALSFDRVAAAAVLPRARGQGTVDVVVAQANGAPDEELVQQLQEYFQKRREIAVDVLVRGPEEVPVAVAVQVKAEAGREWAQVKASVEQALRAWFCGARLGEPVLRARLGNVVFGCEGVENYVLTLPGEDVAVQADALPVLATLTVEEMV